MVSTLVLAAIEQSMIRQPLPFSSALVRIDRRLIVLELYLPLDHQLLFELFHQ
jgi:hypothetical protein